MEKVQRLLEAASKREINGRAVGEIKVKFKDEHWWWKLIPFQSIATTLGRTIWFKSKKWYETNQNTTTRVVLHELVHVFDWVKAPVSFVLRYTLPQATAIFAIPLIVLAVLSRSPYAVAGAILALSALAPWPSYGRALIEKRAYTVEVWAMRSEMFKRGWNIDRRNRETKAILRWLALAYGGRAYYRMVWGGNASKWAQSIAVNANVGGRLLPKELREIIEE